MKLPPAAPRTIFQMRWCSRALAELPGAEPGQNAPNIDNAQPRHTTRRSRHGKQVHAIDAAGTRQHACRTATISTTGVDRSKPALVRGEAPGTDIDVLSTRSAVPAEPWQAIDDFELDHRGGQRVAEVVLAEIGPG